MQRGGTLTGATDQSQGVFSGWFNFAGGDGAVLNLFRNNDGTNTPLLRRETSNKLRFDLQTNAGASLLRVLSSSSLMTASGWFHVLFSWDTNFSVGAKVAHLYINDVSDLGTVSDAASAFAVDQTYSNWAFGAFPGSAANMLNGDTAEIYFAPGQFLDFSVTANRRKFITPLLKPVNLGPTGATPTGTAPLVLFHLDDGEAVANFATNRGTGGNFTITGSLVAAASSPTD